MWVYYYKIVENTKIRYIGEWILLLFCKVTDTYIILHTYYFMKSMNINKEIKCILYDIRAWLLLFFIIRLIGITNAPLEIGHNWRQSLTNMITRNFYEENTTFLYPKIDMAGNQSGIIGTEFPLYNYIMYLLDIIFGYTHWYGRLINLVVSSIGIFFYYKIVKNVLEKKIALYASLVLLSSIWFAFSRKIMPDTFSVSLVLIGLYYVYKYILDGRTIYLVCFFIFATLGMLCKIPALSLMSVLVVVFLSKKVLTSRKRDIFLVSLASVLIVCSWYFYWVPYLVQQYQYPLFFPRTIVEGFKEISGLLPNFFEKFYFSSLCSYVAFVFLLVGVYVLLVKKNRELQWAIGIITTIFFVFILKTGEVFPLHNYYIIPYTPIMALLVALGVAKLPNKYAMIVLFFIMVEGVLNQQHDFFIKKSMLYKLDLEHVLDNHAKPNDLIVINGGASPQDMYFAHRKGWSINASILNKITIEQYKNAGAKFLVIDKKTSDIHIDYYTQVNSDDNYDVYLLQ